MYNTSAKITLEKNEAQRINNSGHYYGQYMNGIHYFKVEGDGNNLLFIVDNESSSDSSFVIKAADNVFCGGDKVFNVPMASISYIYLEGSPYIQQSGEYKGNILVSGNESMSFTVVEML